jgi:periodic tryptophan protein 2
LPFAHRKNITQIALSPKGNLLLSIDEDGRTILTNIPRRIALYHFSFRGKVSAIAFAPSGKHFAVAIEKRIEIWHTPSTPDEAAQGELEFAPFIRHRSLSGHFDDVRSIEWSSDSRFFLTASRDLTARVWSTDPEEGFVPTTLAGHKQSVVRAWFSKDQESIWTISQDGALFQWEYMQKPGTEDEAATEENMQWRIANRHYYLQAHTELKCAAFHPQSNLIVAGFSSGVFFIHELPDFNEIQKLSISQNAIDQITMNKTGEWIAFGASRLGQLLVWEWQSESYILKQQGHYDSMNSIVYSPDGQRIITTADDGKIKVWDVSSGFCIVTFVEHTSGVTACEFAKRGNVLFTASLDGSIRAWDLIRYRNFRTFTAPTRLSFSSLAVDPSGEVVCAGSIDSFDIHVWSVQTGQLLDQLAGHEGPVSSLVFTADGGSLLSGSWDHTVRVWNVFGRTQTSEPLQLQSDVLCVAARPDSKQVAVSTLDGQVAFWSIADAIQTGGVDGRRDVSGGRKLSDRRTAANAAGTKSFTSLVYSADGTCILAGGNSKYICLYDVESGVLLKKFTVSVNLSLEGTQEFLNSRDLTEAGPRGLIDETGDASDLEDRLNTTLPGANRGDRSVRRARPEVRVPAVSFSPTGRSFCAASTEGLLIYSLDNTLQFDPFDLDVTVTPATTLQTLKQKDYLKALVMAFRLNERSLIRCVYEAIPPDAIALVTSEIPTVYIQRLLRFVAQHADESPHLEFNLRWLEALIRIHGRWCKDNAGALAPELRLVQKAVIRVRSELERLAEGNRYMVEYLLSQAKLKREKNALKGDAVKAPDVTYEDDEFEGFGNENPDSMNGMEGIEILDNDDDDDEGEWMGLD